MTNRRILIVDDEPDITEYLEKLLRNEYDVVLAPGGAEAITLFGADKFDIVLTDVRMPGMDGLQLLQTLKRGAPECEVILMSGYADVEAVIHALNEGAFAFVTKPLIREVVISRIQHAVAVVQSRENRQKVFAEMKSQLVTQTRFAQRLSALAAMAGGIAHELSQPLSGIGIYASTIKAMIEKNRPLDQQFLSETVEKIERQVARATAIMEHMKEFSSGAGKSEIVNLKLDQAVERALDLFNLQLKAHGIALVLEIAPELHVRCDQDRFEQVVINLVSNAKDCLKDRPAPPAGPPKRIEFHGSGRGGWVVLDIKDTGPGVREDLVGHLFEPFVTSKIEEGGSGLGLFICQQVLQDIGAKIELHETGPQGTIFRLHFPSR